MRESEKIRTCQGLNHGSLVCQTRILPLVCIAYLFAGTHSSSLRILTLDLNSSKPETLDQAQPPLHKLQPYYRLNFTLNGKQFQVSKVWIQGNSISASCNPLIHQRKNNLETQKGIHPRPIHAVHGSVHSTWNHYK